MNTLSNFRDLGGMRTKEGRMIKEKRLLRSGEVVNLCDGDRQRLIQDYDLKVLVDFRHEGELKEKPDDVMDGVHYLHLDIMKDSMEIAPTEKSMMKVLDPKRVDSFMKEINRQFITSASARLGYQQFFRACLENKEGALLFHCAAGKDRTGFGAALLLKALGVSDEDILEDYLKTVAQRKLVNESIVEKARQKGLTEEQLEALAQLMTVKADYLVAAFEAVNEHYGTFDEYLKKGLEITDAEIEQLKQHYLEA